MHTVADLNYLHYKILHNRKLFFSSIVQFLQQLSKAGSSVILEMDRLSTEMLNSTLKITALVKAGPGPASNLLTTALALGGRVSCVCSHSAPVSFSLRSWLQGIQRHERGKCTQPSSSRSQHSSRASVSSWAQVEDLRKWILKPNTGGRVRWRARPTTEG